jgi:hypothetical protein
MDLVQYERDPYICRVTAFKDMLTIGCMFRQSMSLEICFYFLLYQYVLLIGGHCIIFMRLRLRSAVRQPPPAVSRLVRHRFAATYSTLNVFNVFYRRCPASSPAVPSPPGQILYRFPLYLCTLVCSTYSRSNHKYRYPWRFVSTEQSVALLRND